MERRLLVVLAAIAVAVVAVGLSAAATMSRGDSVQPAKDVQRMKPKPAKKADVRVSKQNVEAPVVTSSQKPQSVEEVKSYWTQQRMEDAQPMEKARQGGSPSSSPAPSKTTAPGNAPTKRAPATKPSAKSSQSPGATGVSTSPTATTDPNYWTDDAMADAQPMDNTRPGGTGSQGDPDAGGATVPGSPPP